jgi:hypothetical protein
MDEIGRIDDGNLEYVVFWDCEEKRPRVQRDYDFTPMRPDQSVHDTLFEVFGSRKRITELMVGCRTACRTALPFEYSMVRDLTWKELKDLGLYLNFRVSAQFPSPRG